MKKYYYLIHFQFLGFRYHGWQKQPQVKTVQGMLEKTLTFVLGHDNYRTLGSSRTDAMVSAEGGVFELFTKEPIDTEAIFDLLNENLPSDIKALKIEETDKHFNIIQHSKTKEYLYLFSFGAKNHPFAAPFMSYIIQDLDLELMKKGAKLFQGAHHFKNYAYKPSDITVFDRVIDEAEIIENNLYTANFFPEKSYIFRVKGEGFMRYQVRLMMGALFLLGKGEITLAALQQSIDGSEDGAFSYIAPASGLILKGVEFD